MLAKKKWAATICLSAVLAAGAAYGQTAPGSEGSGEAPRAVPGGAGVEALELDRAVPVEVPDVDIDEVGRDLVLDPEKRRQSFGTVGRSSGGEETREPASGELLRTLDGAGLDPNMDPAFGESGERQVFGEDDRVQVSDTRKYPFRAFGLLVGQTRDGETAACSATLIGPSSLLTAAHCLYSHESGGWLDDFIFVPALNGIEDVPFGTYEYDTAYVFQGYVENYQGSYGSVVPWDIAVVTLQEPIGEELGWLGYGHDADLGNFLANIIGYPGDKPVGTQWRANCTVEKENVADLYFTYDCDTFAGSSGSAVYKYDPETQERIILGINVAESEVTNVAVRMNQTYFQWVSGLIK